MDNVISMGFVGGKKKDIASPASLDSATKIFSCTKFNPVFLGQIASVCKQLRSALDENEKALQAAYRAIANKDEKGEAIIKQTEGPNGQIIASYDLTPENKLIADRLFEDAQNSEIKLIPSVQKIYLSKLGDAALSPMDVLNLEWLIDSEK